MRRKTAARSKKQPPALLEPAALTQPGPATLPQIPPTENDSPTITRDPDFKTIYEEWRARGEQLDWLQEIFASCRYSIRDFETLKGVLDDAFMLYDVSTGKIPAGKLLAAFKTHTTPEVFRAIAVDLSEALAPHLEEFLRELDGVGPHDEAMLRLLGRLGRLREIATEGAPPA